MDTEGDEDMERGNFGSTLIVDDDYDDKAHNYYSHQRLPSSSFPSKLKKNLKLNDIYSSTPRIDLDGYLKRISPQNTVSHFSNRLKDKSFNFGPSAGGRRDPDLQQSQEDDDENYDDIIVRRID